MDLRDRIGANIRKLRQHRFLSQEALSLAAGLERGYVGRLERSEYSTSLATLQKLALALDIDPSELTEPVQVSPKKKPEKAHTEISEKSADCIGPQLLATPFQEGFERQGNGLVLILIDYRWNDGSTVRRWLVDPKRVKNSTIVFKPCEIP
ncbi:helix-turn-helix domain-containing protein [Tateyamaria sp.]|nr:helix-turn-helix domain-containing protein [Tateyamaria sp.]